VAASLGLQGLDARLAAQAVVDEKEEPVALGVPLLDRLCEIVEKSPFWGCRSAQKRIRRAHEQARARASFYLGWLCT
jgi:hypothetical protein